MNLTRRGLFGFLPGLAVASTIDPSTQVTLPKLSDPTFRETVRMAMGLLGLLDAPAGEEPSLNDLTFAHRFWVPGITPEDLAQRLQPYYFAKSTAGWVSGPQLQPGDTFTVAGVFV